MLKLFSSTCVCVQVSQFGGANSAIALALGLAGQHIAHRVVQVCPSRDLQFSCKPIMASRRDPLQNNLNSGMSLAQILKLPVATLKLCLDQYHLAQGGNKKEIAKRLHDHLSSTRGSDPPSSHSSQSSSGGSTSDDSSPEGSQSRAGDTPSGESSGSQDTGRQHRHRQARRHQRGTSKHHHHQARHHQRDSSRKRHQRDSQSTHRARRHQRDTRSRRNHADRSSSVDDRARSPLPATRRKRSRVEISDPGSPSPKHRRRHHRWVSSSSSSSSSGNSDTTSETSSSDTSSERGSKSRKRSKRRRKGRKRRSRQDWPDYTPQDSIACAPPIERKLRNRVQRGKYTNFDKLLLGTHKPPSLQKQKSDKKHHRQVADLPSWLQAWNRYLCARVADCPSMALELAKYQTIMVMFFEKHPPQLCIEYDKLFRQAAALDRSLRWDTIKEDVYVWSITQRHSFREKSSISSRLGPPNTDTTKPPDRTTHTATGKEICKRFNHNRCTRGSECIFAHVCWHPGCQGLHPGAGCPKKA